MLYKRTSHKARSNLGQINSVSNVSIATAGSKEWTDRFNHIDEGTSVAAPSPRPAFRDPLESPTIVASGLVDDVVMMSLSF